MKSMLFSLATLMAAGPVAAEGITTYALDSSFDDATFALESAIVGRGLVIDHVSHVGEMLARTGADVGSDVQLFEAADVFLFCSAITSRSVMEADLMNIAFCPYGMFVADTGEETVVGFRNFPEGAMQEVQALLEEIAQEVADN
jgi:uncharacterized protein (DUF302 family)